MTISIVSLPEFVQRAVGSTASSVALALDDSIGGSSVDVELVGGDRRVLRIALVPLSRGTNVRTLEIPAGMWDLRVLDRATGDPVAGAIVSVGDIWLYAGQSNAEGMWTAVSERPPSPLPQTRMYRARAWQPPTGDGLITLLNGLATRTGVPQAVLAMAVGGTALTYEGFAVYVYGCGLNQNGYWLDREGALWTELIAAVDAVGGAIAGMIWDQGESDTCGVSAQRYRDGLAELWKRLQARVTDRKPPTLRLAIVELGYYPTSFPEAGAVKFDVRPVVEAQRELAREADGVFIAATRHDLPRDATNVHLTPEGYATLGLRLAGAIAAGLPAVER